MGETITGVTRSTVFHDILMKLSVEARGGLVKHDFNGLLAYAILVLDELDPEFGELDKLHTGVSTHEYINIVREHAARSFNDVADTAQRYIDDDKVIVNSAVTTDQIKAMQQRLRAMAQLVPIMTTSMSYFLSNDSMILTDLREQRIDIRVLADFFGITLSIQDQDEADLQIDGALCMALFNVLRNAENADVGVDPERKGEGFNIHMDSLGIQIHNKSRKPIGENVMQKLTNPSNELGGHYGLFIAGYYITELHGELSVSQELDQSKSHWNIVTRIQWAQEKPLVR